MKNLLLILAYIGCIIPSFSQLAVNPGADTTSAEHREIFHFWQEYLDTQPSKNTTAHLSFWNEEDKKEWKQPDLILHAINGEHSTFTMGYPTLLSILPFKNNFYQVKTLVGGSNENGYINVLAITNHYVKKNKAGKYELYSPLRIQDDIKQLETVDFKVYSLKGATISQDSLYLLSGFIRQVKKDHGIGETKRITIIYGRNSKERDYLLGFDFNMMSSANNPASGMSDIENNTIILNGLSPIFHETTHLLLNPLYPESPLLEGIATFYGGSMGKSLNDGIKFMNAYCEQKPDLDLYKKLLEGNFYINNMYNPNYIVQGLLIREAYKKGGVDEIKKLLNCKSWNEVSIYFSLSTPESINLFLRNKLKE